MSNFDNDCTESGLKLQPCDAASHELVIKYTKLKPKLIKNKFPQKMINFLGHGTKTKGNMYQLVNFLAKTTLLCVFAGRLMDNL